MLLLLCIVVSCGLTVIPTESAKILAVFPVPSISHQIVFRPLTQELARRGHEVTVITTDPAFPKGRTPPNLTEIDVHDISYNIWKENFIAAPKGNNDDVFTTLDAIFKTLPIVVDAELKAKEVQHLIRDKQKKFDLVLVEAAIKPVLIFSHIYKAPVIQVSSFGAWIDNYETIGAPIHPTLYPGIIRQKLNNLTIWEKIKELYLHYTIQRMNKNSYSADDEMLRKHFGPEIPSVEELSNNVDMLFLNVHPVFEGIRPVPPSVVYMGGLHQKPEKELPTDLKSFLDSSKNGVIYISFGTNVDPSFLPPEKIQTLVRVFSQLPYDVLWKWNQNVLPGRTDNIRISKWLPQSDLLRHPKIKLFITQGGLQSTDEAITAGVPLIGVPMLGDQWFNVEKYLYLKIGLRLDMERMSDENLKNAITTVIGDDSYRHNIEKVRSVMLDQPQSPLERAVWWTEHVLRHGGARHLRSPAANITWAQYLELELVLTLFIGLLTVMTVSIMIVYLLYKNIFRKYVGIKLKRT